MRRFTILTSLMALLIASVIAGSAHGQATVQSVKSRAVLAAHKKYLQSFGQITKWSDSQLANWERLHESNLQACRMRLAEAISDEFEKAMKAEDVDEAVRLRDLKGAVESGEVPDLSITEAEGIVSAHKEYLQAVEAARAELVSGRREVDQQRRTKLARVRKALTDAIGPEIKAAMRREDLDEAAHLKDLAEAVGASEEPVEMYDYAGMTDAINSQKSWKVLGGKWAIREGRIVGSGDSLLVFKEDLPSEGVLTFKMKVREGLRPRIHIVEGIWFGNEGFEPTLGFHSKGKLFVGGSYRYMIDTELLVKIIMGPDVLQAYVDDVFASSIARPEGMDLKLALSGGDGWSPGRTEFYDLTISPISRDDSDRPHAGSTD